MGPLFLAFQRCTFAFAAVLRIGSIVFVDRTARMLVECFPTCHRRQHHDIVLLRLDTQALVRSACSNSMALRPPVFGMRSTILRVIVSAVPKPGEIREAENILGAT